ncbi:hypothetical protein GlitD10_1884 [Gloeomargarita lithophora Alchichica-D10]|uniref:DUF4159 domain-containing protein n=1 Tax=Gloeomargarita lithophora Alchichica-D10 TaxID=1188229 RepID=A0A1J0AE43_9CYAN|nr:DUF4159 domain-containing protein [Gloeomargarita lithophora]APB34210.1 hypothetical protein GlitD10_1884 [Gloeomargarita lithophora Alchichica-D10]
MEPVNGLKPLERLEVRDGLLLNAQRWQCAHGYLRQRQNLYYQGLCTGGIVQGLGVQVIPPPPQVAAEYADRRWVRIHPGWGIDGLGNPVIVPEPLDFRITTVPNQEQAVTVYLVLRYVDPAGLVTTPTQDIVQETFRVDEKNVPPSPEEIELCRVVLTAGSNGLEIPPQPLFPEANHLDVRFRVPAQLRPQALVRVAQLDNGPVPWGELLTACRGLYPALRVAEPVGLLPVSLVTPDLLRYDLIYLTHPQVTTLPAAAQSQIRDYLHRGGVVLVEANSPQIAQLQAMQAELLEAVAASRERAETRELSIKLSQELRGVEASLTQAYDALTVPVKMVLFGQPPTNSGTVGRGHPLRCQPFTFGAWPSVGKRPLRVSQWGGLVLVTGALSQGWGGDDTLERETIRAAQELGVNLLHFAWHVHRCRQGLQGETT